MIHNLLERVEKLADKQKIIFRGLKKGSDNEEEESFYKGKLIKTDKNDKHFINELQKIKPFFLLEQNTIYLKNFITTN